MCIFGATCLLSRRKVQSRPASAFITGTGLGDLYRELLVCQIWGLDWTGRSLRHKDRWTGLFLRPSPSLATGQDGEHPKPNQSPLADGTVCRRKVNQVQIHIYDFQCDELTGQCRCVPGVKSRDCSQCAPRHVLTAAKSCNDCNGVCTGTLAS